MIVTRDSRLTIDEALRQAGAAFAGHSESARLDAGVLLGFIMGRSRSWIIAHPETQLTAGECATLEKALAEVSKGVPLPYLTGHQEFFGLDIFVSSEVLIPRPDTELMVELALKWINTRPGHILAADIGTGSGCIAVALALNAPDLTIYAMDISILALRMARRNIRLHSLEDRIHLLRGDLMDALPQKMDVICANLPYIPAPALDRLPQIRYEPHQALDGGMDGLDLIRRLLMQAPLVVRPGGIIFLEIETDQGSRVIALARESFPDADICCYPDLAGKDRVVAIELTGLSGTIPVG